MSPNNTILRWLILCVCLGFVAHVAADANDEPKPGDDNEQRQVIARTSQDVIVQGELIGFDLAGELLLHVEATGGNPDKKRLPVSNLLEIEFPNRKVNRRATSIEILLHSDDVLVGRIGKGNDTKIEINEQSLGILNIPLESVRMILASTPASAEQRKAIDALSKRQSKDDVVLLGNGDTISGFVSQITEQSVSIDTSTNQIELPFEVIRAVRLAEQPELTPPPLPRAMIALRSGGRATATSMKWRDGTVQATLAHGSPPVEFAGAEILSVELASDRWTWLSELRPIRQTQISTGALDWQMMRNRNALGKPLAVGGVEFKRGLGVHSKCSLVYQLDRVYTEFICSYGLDDSAGPWADVDVKIIVDGDTRLNLTGVRSGGLLGPIRIDVTGASELELQAYCGRNGDIQDRFNWIEPRLIK